MAHAAPSPDLGLSIRHEDLDDLEALFQKNWDLSGSLRLLAELQGVPGMITGSEDFDAVQARAQKTLQYLPGMMHILADAVDARAEEGLRAVGLVRDHGRFREAQDGRPVGCEPEPLQD